MATAKRVRERMDTVEREDLQANLSTTLTRHMEEFRREREEWERAKAEEEATKREREAAAQRAAYDRLIELNQQEAEQRVEAEKLRNKLLAALVTILTAAGGSGAYVLSQPKPKQVETKEVKDAVEKNSTAIDRRVEAVESKVEALGTASVESQVAQAEGVDYIVKKIDAAHPRSAEKVKEPEAVEEARIRAGEIQLKQRKAKVLGEKYDPFADLPNP